MVVEVELAYCLIEIIPQSLLQQPVALVCWWLYNEVINLVVDCRKGSFLFLEVVVEKQLRPSQHARKKLNLMLLRLFVLFISTLL